METLKIIRTAASDFANSIICPKYFILFNILCVLQTIPALYYYISFFKKGFFMPHTSGMNTVWGATIGSICSVIVTSALGPLPPNTIIRPFCIGVIVWEYLIFFSLIIAAICLGLMGDMNGVVWATIGSLSGLLSGLFLTWLGQNLRTIKARHGYNLTHHNDNLADLSSISIDVPLPSASDAIAPISNLQVVLGDSEDMRHVEKVDVELPNTSHQQWGIKFYIVQSVLWLILLIFCAISVGFGVNQALTAAEFFRYPSPGRLHRVSLSASDSREVDMHLHCEGQAAEGPVLLFEADAISSGFVFYGLQRELVSLGWTTCTYDRAGYGWSQMAALGENSPEDTAHRLHLLLNVSGVLRINSTSSRSRPLVLIGHGTGTELVQIYEHKYSSQVLAVVLLDGYSSVYRLRETTSKALKKESESLCGGYQIARAMEGVGFARPATTMALQTAEEQGEGFTPHSQLQRFSTTQTTGRYWATVYSDFCVNPNDLVRNTDYLTSLGNNSVVAAKYQGRINWPTLGSQVKALVIPASSSLLGSYGDLYSDQVTLYMSTLSSQLSNIKLVVCHDCKHSFPFDSDYGIRWTASAIDSFLA